MSKEKPLSARQLAVIEDLFEDKQEQEILEKHNLSRKLYNKWLSDGAFTSHLDRRIVWEYRRCEFMLAHHALEAVTNLVKLTDPKQPETARKACLDIITMRSAANRLADSPAVPGDNPTSPPESLNLSSEAAGKILAVLAEEKTAS